MPRTRKSVLLSQENIIETIVTPKRSKGKPQKRRISDESEDSSPNKSSRSDSLSPTITKRLNEQLIVSKSKYGTAKRALTDNSTFRLPGRELQFDELTEFLNELIKTKTSASLYINGPPGKSHLMCSIKLLINEFVGTGKTATLLKIVNTKEYEEKLNIAFINSTGISSIGAIYKKICNELKLKYDGNGSEKECLAKIEKYFASSPKKTTLLIIDEIDQLCTTGKNQNVLYHIFEWPSVLRSRLILIGIANSLDLTDRLLVRLQTKCELKPKVMHFPAYTKAQIIDIFKSRLEESDLFPPAAIQLLATKVASVSGDIRKALNLGKRVVEIAVLNKAKSDKALDLKQLEGIIEGDENTPTAAKVEPKIQLNEVMTVLNSVYGGTKSVDVDESFPLQQKLLICTMLLIIKHGNSKDITIGKLHDIYRKVCKNRNIQSTDLSEFVNLCLLVETKGILKLTMKKEPRFHKIHLQWNEEEVLAALKDKQMITNILNERSLLAK